MSLAFIGLNILDAHLTKVALATGAVELNPVAVPFGASMLWRGLLAALIAFGLWKVGVKRWLLPLNIILIGVVAWNATQCLIGLVVNI